MSYDFPHDERIARLRLARTQGIGPITFRRLIERYSSAENAIEALPELAKNGGRKKPYDVTPKQDALNEYERLQSLDGTLFVWGEPGYPSLLAVLEDAPCTLSVLGNAHCLSHPGIGIVGSRNASLQGRKMAEKIAHDLGKANLQVISGLARGIDTAAHSASLDTGTIAVLAGGVNVVYPTENQKLYDDIIAKNGAIVGENILDLQPAARHFPRRNRIISGLAKGVVIVEGTLKSGSLITAHMAADHGREVFAVPGHPFDPRANGPNALIKDGATLVSSAQDVLDTFTRLPTLHHIREPDTIAFETTPDEPDGNTLEETRQRLESLLSTVPTAVDELIREAMLPTAAVQTVLLEWELAGQLTRHPGNRVSASFDNEVVDKAAGHL